MGCLMDKGADDIQWNWRTLVRNIRSGSRESVPKSITIRIVMIAPTWHENQTLSDGSEHSELRDVFHNRD